MTVYLITNMVNGKQYVGITKRNPETRWYEHKTDYFKTNDDGSYKYNNPIARAIRKYGVKKFRFQIIEDNIKDYDTLNQREIYWIDVFGTYRHGYNATIGGDGNNGHEAWNKGKKCPQLAGENNYWYGKHITDNMKQAISKANKGREAWNKGKHHTEESKQKMSEAKKGENNPNYGKICTEEKRQNHINGAHSKSCICVETGELFNSSSAAARWLSAEINNPKACASGVSQSCNNGYTYLGYHFKRL